MATFDHKRAHMAVGGLRRFDAPRELSFLLRIEATMVDGLTSSIKHGCKPAVSDPRPCEARHAVRVDTCDMASM